MNIWAKMITALRGGATEVGEAIVDTQALRILDQEVRDSSEELRQSKDSLAAIIARQKLAEEKCQQIREQISKHEGYATQALGKGKKPWLWKLHKKLQTWRISYAARTRPRKNTPVVPNNCAKRFVRLSKILSV